MRVSAAQAAPGGLVGHRELTRRLAAHVRALARPRHRTAQPLANRQTRERLCDLLATWGYRISVQGPLHNVVATPPGKIGPLPAVCAHYDSVPGSPGADDNASALAVMLEVARAAASRGASVAAISFNGEEDDLAGSRDFAAACAGLGLELTVAHVLEMVVGLRAYLGAERLLPDLARSDHAPLWQAGVPALFWTDTAEYRNPNDHRSGDTPDTLDYDFMTRVALLLCQVMFS